MRALKQNFGPSSLVALISGVLSTVAVVITILVAVGSPFAKQVETNTVVKGLETAVKENRDEQAKALAASREEQNRALNEAVAEIKSLVSRSVDLAEQNRAEMRAMRESSERQLIEVRQDTKALWNWLGELKNKITTVEAEVKRK